MAPRDANLPPGGPSPSRKPKAERAGWRSSSARPQRPEVTVARSWWGVRRSQPSQNVSLRLKLTVLLVLLAILVAGFIIFLRDKPTKVPLIALAATYRGASTLPPNPWCIEDFERFQSYFGDGAQGKSWFGSSGSAEVDVILSPDSFGWGTSPGKLTDKALKQLDEKLQHSSASGPGKALVLYFSAHGVVNSSGEPCLLLEDSSATDQDTWLSVDALCKKICDAKPGADVKKVLVLDSNRLAYDASCGLLYNSFADALAELVDQLDKKRCAGLVVLNSSSPHEIAWSAPERAGSVFGYYFCRALGGLADADANGRVTIKELAEFLHGSVNKWVTAHRSGTQRPMLLWVADEHDRKDFPVAYCSSGRLSAGAKAGEKQRLEDAYKVWNDKATWSDVAKLWQTHDRLKKEFLYAIDPLAWARLERDLLRLEQLLLSGKAYAGASSEALRSLQAGITSDTLKLRSNVVAFNLPLARYFSGAWPAESSSMSAQPDSPGPAAPVAGRHERAAAEAWSNLVKKGSLSAADVRQALAAIKNTRAKSEPEVIEIHFLRMLDRYVDPASISSELLTRAIKSRDLAERAATPGDPRARYWIAAKVEGADKARRVAEDLLFVGPPALDRANKVSSDFSHLESRNWQNADEGFLAAENLANDVAKAFELRDRGLAQAPYLVQWLWSARILSPAGERRGGKETPSESDMLAEQWDRLPRVVNQLHELSMALDEQLLSSANVWQQPATRELDENMRLLGEAFQERSISLDDEGQQQENLTKIERHLALPLIAAAQRGSLRDKLLGTLAAKFQDNVSQLDRDEIATSEAAPSQEAVRPPAGLLGAMGAHPLVDLLAADVGEPAPAKKPAGEEPPAPSWSDRWRELAKQGGEVRNRLARLGPRVADSLEESRKQLTALNERLENEPKFSERPLDGRRIAELRKPCSHADRLLRAAAAVCDTQRILDATQELAQFDLFNLMTWSCRRALDDFWAAMEPSEKPYFQQVAQSYLDAAGKLLNKPEPRALRAYCQGLLARRERAARELLIASSPDDVSIRKEDPQWTRLPLTIQRESSDLPQGVAATCVRYRDGEAGELLPLATTRPAAQATGSGNPPLLAMRRIAVPLEGALESGSLGPVEQMPDGTPVEYWFKPQPRALEADVYYRGHQRKTPIELSPPGVQIAFRPRRMPEPTVRVHGDERVPTSVMFIFDCSASMREVDFARGDGTKVRRLDGARDTLISILREPGLRQLRGVGLRLYGHRFGRFERNPEVQASKYAKAQRQQATQQGKAYPTLHPGEDVELAFSIAPFDDQRREEIAKLLSELEPWGFTPLYLAISEAINDPRVKDEVRRIIVITDGFNDQGVPPNRLVTAKRLEELFKPNPNTTLDIIGFGNEFAGNLTAKQREDLQDMKRIAHARGGDFYQAATAGDLLDHIQRSLRLAKFEVVPLAESSDEQPARLELENETWREDPRVRAGSQSPRKIKYDVRVVGMDSPQTPQMPIVLEGGEAIELFLERVGGASALLYRYYYKSAGGDRIDTNGRDRTSIDEQLNVLGRIVPPPDPAVRAAPRHWVVASPPPVWNDQDKLATFYISIQNHDLTRFSPRPAEAWIEITPLSEDGEPDEIVYRFCDLDYFPATPVPRLTCEAQQFPRDTCKTAQVKLWFKMEPTRSDATVVRTVAELSNDPETIDGVRLTAEIVKEADAQGNTAVRIIEQRSVKEGGKFQPGRVKIEIEPPPAKVEHEYSARRHAFYFDRDREVANYKVRLTSVERFKKEAVGCTLPTVKVGR